MLALKSCMETRSLTIAIACQMKILARRLRKGLGHAQFSIQSIVNHILEWKLLVTVKIMEWMTA